MLTAEKIILDDRELIRVKHHGYLIGYFSSPEEIVEVLATMNLSLADITTI